MSATQHKTGKWFFVNKIFVLVTWFLCQITDNVYVNCTLSQLLELLLFSVSFFPDLKGGEKRGNMRNRSEGRMSVNHRKHRGGLTFFWMRGGSLHSDSSFTRPCWEYLYAESRVAWCRHKTNRSLNGFNTHKNVYTCCTIGFWTCQLTFKYLKIVFPT